MASDSAEPVKTALVCLGDRKREIQFVEGAFHNAVFKAYSDVLGGNEHIIWQLKREDWAGEFIDMEADSPVPDRSVVRAVIVGGPSSSEEVSLFNMYTRASGYW